MTEEKLSKIVQAALDLLITNQKKCFDDNFKKSEHSGKPITYDVAVDLLKISLEESARENAYMIQMILQEVLEIPHQE